MAMLEVEGLTVDIVRAGLAYRILDDVSLAVDIGESLGIVGESGCGKTMTALAIMGLLPDAARATGSVRFDSIEYLGAHDDDLTTLRGARIAMVFQEPMSALNPVRTIADQVGEGARLHLGLSARAARERARELMERVGLPADQVAPDSYPHQMSGGQRQRAMIAAALSAGPSLLIADEPTTALDVTSQSRILDLIVSVTEAEGMALVMISHDLGVIAEMTDRMIVMYAGAVAERGLTASVFAAPGHPYTQALLEALPRLNAGEAPAGRRLRTIPGQVPRPQSTLRIGCPFAPRCRHAMPRCRAAIPPAVAFSPGHVASCFNPVNA